MHGAFDTAKIDNALRLLDERGVVITRALDIGANIGTTTLELLARRPDLRIDCFEPEPFNFRLLEPQIGRRSRSASGDPRRPGPTHDDPVRH